MFPGAAAAPRNIFENHWSRGNFETNNSGISVGLQSCVFSKGLNVLHRLVGRLCFLQSHKNQGSGASCSVRKEGLLKKKEGREEKRVYGGKETQPITKRVGQSRTISATKSIR